MRPTEIIIAHQATDFDALGSMLAARRLYPGAQVVLHGGLNRNVREFVALHEGELDLVEAARCDLSGVTRAIVVETASIDRLGELAEVVRRPGVETVLFDHHGGEPRGVGRPRGDQRRRRALHHDGGDPRRARASSRRRPRRPRWPWASTRTRDR